MIATLVFRGLTVLLTLSLGCKEQEPKRAPVPTPETQVAAERSAESADTGSLSPTEILATVPLYDGLHYFATAAGNHPTIYLRRESNELVVVGRERSLGGGTSVEKRFPATKIDEAVAAYKAHLVALGYKPAGEPLPPEPDPNQLVAIPASDLLGGGPDATGRFTKAQSETLYRTRPSDAWKTFSGFAHPSNDAPLLAAGGSGLTLLAPGLELEHKWPDSEAAFKKFRAAIAKPARSATPPGK